MIGKPIWFKPRKYSGWGLYPQTWQGWAYLLAAAAIYLGISLIPSGFSQYRTFAYVVIPVLLVFDVIDIMIRMPRDERDRIHEAIAERNATWVMLVVLAAGLIYRAWSSPAEAVYVDPVIMAALIGGLLTKAVSNFYLDKKN